MWQTGLRVAQSKSKSELPNPNRASACSAGAGQAQIRQAACSLDDDSKLRRANLQGYMAGPTAGICISASSYRLRLGVASLDTPALDQRRTFSPPIPSTRRSRESRVGRGVRKGGLASSPSSCLRGLLHRGDFRKCAPTQTRFAMSTGSPLRSVDPFQPVRPGHVPQHLGMSPDGNSRRQELMDSPFHSHRTPGNNSDTQAYNSVGSHLSAPPGLAYRANTFAVQARFVIAS